MTYTAASQKVQIRRLHSVEEQNTCMEQWSEAVTNTANNKIFTFTIQPKCLLY